MSERLSPSIMPKGNGLNEIPLAPDPDETLRDQLEYLRDSQYGTHPPARPDMREWQKLPTNKNPWRAEVPPAPSLQTTWGKPSSQADPSTRRGK